MHIAAFVVTLLLLANMILKTSSSTPLLCELADAEFSTPISRRSSSKARLLHLRCNSSAFGKVRSENDLHKLDREKGGHFYGEAADEKPSSLYRPRMKMYDYDDSATEKYSSVTSVGYETDLMGVGGGFGTGEGEAFSGSEGGGDLDGYYRKLLEANPGNPLLLTNYARFSYEVKNDVSKAEEHFERAILASPGDADVLCLYAKLIWEVYNDKSRAESYFQRAVEAAPDDCYVVGGYAHFLWNTAEEDEEAAATAPVKESHVFSNGSTGTVSVSSCC